jgi:hypothetical protein
MTNQQITEQKRLEEILKLARMQLNEEYMKKHSAAHTTWLTSARTAWNSSGVLLPFSTKFVYPSEEEVVARGVEIYNTLTLKNADTVAPVEPTPATDQIPVIEGITIEPTVELLQAGGDFVIAEVEEELPVESISEDISDVEIKKETPNIPEPTVTEPDVAEPTVTDSLLESKFKSLFTKWGGRGNY